MSGTSSGGRTAAATNKELYGEDYYARIGAQGGRNGSKGKGFASMDKDQHREASSKGGQLGSPTGWTKQKYLERVKQYAQTHNQKEAA